MADILIVLMKRYCKVMVDHESFVSFILTFEVVKSIGNVANLSNGAKKLIC